MPKGICTTFLTVVSLASSPGLAAQVYRCESDGGVVFSDMPCSEGAEQIEVQGDVVDMRGVGSPGTQPLDPPASVNAPEPQPEAPPSSGQRLNQFLDTLRTQRDQQLRLIDQQIAQLQSRANSPGFSDLGEEQQAAVNNQIISLESNKAALVSEYEALIAEAERRRE